MSEQPRPPGSNRFSASHIWTAHMKGLKNRNFRSPQPRGAADLFARVVLYLVPVLLGAAAYLASAKVVAVDGLLAAAGVLAGGLFMAFTQVAAWRDRYTERQADRHASELPQRYSLDETVAHILMATYACLGLLVTVLVSANFADKHGHLVGIGAALVIAVGTYILLLMLIILPKLYTAYAVTHEVDQEMSGLSRH